MKKKITLLIASLALLLASSTVWGQQGKGALLPEYQEQVTPRRGDANTTGSIGYIVTPGNVNNEFGAGESATITNGNVTIPSSNGMHSPPNSIQLGSEFSQNIVIKSYNSGAYTAGWLEAQAHLLRCSNPPSTMAYTEGWKSGYIYLNQIDFASDPAVGLLLTNASAYEINATTVGVNVTPLHGNITPQSPTFTFGHQYGSSPYTTTMVTGTPFTPTVTTTPIQNYEDDGVELIQYSGSNAIAPSHFVVSHAGTPLTNSVGSNPGLVPYIRPTTVAISGNNNVFDNILLKNTDWWYATYMAQAGVPGTTQSATHTSCCHMDGIQGIPYDATFSQTGSDIGKDTRVDVAVQLLNGARVCVNTDVLDQTNNINTLASTDRPSYEKTNAIIALPVADRVTFRTAGDFQVNMVHESNSSTNVFYSATNFPNPDVDIYLYTGASTESFGQSMTSFANSKYTTVTTKAPYLGTTSSLFGVNGNYLHTGYMTDIHTDSTTFDNSNPGVIEVGTTTAGKSHFHVYGNGMLKNYEGCNAGLNFPMFFGSTKGGTPQLKINTNDTLYIVNFGNNGLNYCDAGLLFHTTSVDSLKYAFTGTGAGALQIQALSDLRLRGDGVWDAATKGNNIYLLSDGGNISTQKLDILSDNMGGAGHGLITFWAETDSKTDACAGNSNGNRFSKSGNIYFNDAVTFTRDESATTQTNIIAANNIRTASLTSTNLNDEDTTNIISRMGDIYLGYSAGIPIYSASDVYPTLNGLTGNGNIFSYNGTGTSGTLNILAGFDDQANTSRFGGGNIYFTRINAAMTAVNDHATYIMIPFSNEYQCGIDDALHLRAGTSMQRYEHAGIIGGVGRGGKEAAFSDYAELLEEPGTATALTVVDTSLVYTANKGDLTVDAGTRGNIIMNTGSSLDFQGDNGNGFFRTRYGDIDMRGATDATNLNGGLLFLASSDEANKWKTGSVCGCTEQRNNVYLQDFQYTNGGAYNGSVFVGADNNIKLNYGGLTNRATQADPFLSKEYSPTVNWGNPYNGNYHCDLNPTVNQARNLVLNFNGVDGGFAAVAADRIDVYKQLIYTGGTGAGMGAVPGQSSLQGETVAGYGLYMKTTAAKDSWSFNGLEGDFPKCPFSCEADNCTDAALHNIVRMTFHDDVRIYANNQKVLLASPVIESYGHMELDVVNATGSNTSLTVRADSLIFHDSMILNETTTNKVKFETWSSDLKTPIMKFGYKRTSPPVQEIIYKEDGTPFYCNECVTHTKGDPDSKIDTMVVMFKNDASLERSESTIVDHTVITFLTDSFDHVKGGLIRNAKMYTDLFKVRNQVEFWRDAARTRDGHLELISEEQMGSKDYAGVYTRHLHMEPVGACGRPYSELWLCDPALDVITTSTFGGYGKIQADVHVEIEAKLAPGYASLGLRGNCYEQKAGTLAMEDLRLDKGAQIHYTIGDMLGFNNEYTDCIEADEITLYGDVFIHVEKRACQNYVPGCYPIIRYNSLAIGESNLNNLKLATTSIDGIPLTLNMATPGVVYLCVGENVTPSILREIHIPQTPGVTMVSPPEYGNHYVGSYGHFYFTVKYNSEPPLKVTTNRMINGVAEELVGTKNANGEYEYVIRIVRENIVLQFGPDYATDNIEIVDGKAVWYYGNTIYIRVEKDDIASIYSIAGQLVKRVDLTEGSTPIPMTRGIYIVTLKDGSVHKVILK